MDIRFPLAFLIGKKTSLLLRLKGGGSALPGLLALRVDRNFLSQYRNSFRKGIILVSGTNGKTTSTTLLKKIIENSGDTFIHNASGSNLLRGIASAIIDKSNIFGRISADWGIFETDEATLPSAINQLTPNMTIILNLFRDQLDRYGEIDALAGEWKNALSELNSDCHVVLNADDPVVAYLGEGLSAQVSYFGLQDTNISQDKPSQSADSIFCPQCQHELIFTSVTYSHLGEWSCPNCLLERPKPNVTVSHVMLKPKLSFSITGVTAIDRVQTVLEGVYNAGNIGAIVLTASLLGFKPGVIKKTVIAFKPVFGRLEEFTKDNKNIKLLLSKNPTGFTESIKTISGDPKKHILLVLNDHIADGQDISWIYDVEFERLKWISTHITVSGTRAEDLLVRLKYADIPADILALEKKLRNAIELALSHMREGETLYILATYTAMLDTRKILTGKSLL